ncbi:MAG: glycerophosphodiester phosphodiesterase family protein [Bacteroidota bacterium]
MKTIKRIFLILLCTAFVLLIAFVIAGGGFGKKKGITTLSFPGNQSELLFAHRGIGNYFPENSEAGFEAAAEAGFKAIETDIHLTSDDVPVIFHDDNCQRLLGINKEVNQFAAAELTKQKILFDGKPSASTVITLQEVAEKFGNRFVIYLDVKLHSIHMAEKIASLIKKNHLESSTIVANSNLLFISYLEFFYPEINTVMEGFTPGKEWFYKLIPKNFRPDFLSSFAEDVNAEHIQWIRENGLEANRIVYGVTSKDVNQVLESGIQKIILDYDSTMQETVLKSR